MNPIHQPQKTTRKKLLLCVILAGGFLVGIFSFKKGQNNSPEGFSLWKDIFAWCVNDSFCLLRRRRVALRQAVTSAIFTPKAKLNILPPPWILAERMFMFLLGHCGTSFVSYIPNKFHFQGLTWVFLQLKKNGDNKNNFFDKQPCEETKYSVDWWFNFPFSDTVFDQSPFPQTDWLSLFQNICDRNSMDNSGKHLTRCAWLQSPGVIILQVNVVKTPAASDQIKPVCQLFLDSLLPAWTACLPLIGPTSPLFLHFRIHLTACLCLHRLSRNGTPRWEEKGEKKKRKRFT